jgi:hypothetical protein
MVLSGKALSQTGVQYAMQDKDTESSSKFLTAAQGINPESSHKVRAELDC